MENPLVGVFNRERTMLVFRQRSLEVYAAYLAGAGGSLLGFWGLLGILTGRLGSQTAAWYVFTGAMFAGAAYWAFKMFRSFTFDLRKRTYAERFGANFKPQFLSGSFQDFKCLEIAPYQSFVPTGFTMTNMRGGMQAMPNQLLVLRLWYNDPRRPPAVLEHFTSDAAGYVHDGRAVTFGQKAITYANAIGIPLHSCIPLQ